MLTHGHSSFLHRVFGSCPVLKIAFTIGSEKTEKQSQVYKLKVPGSKI